MDLAKYLLVTIGFFFALATGANAQGFFAGSNGVQEASSTGIFTTSSLTMDVTNYTEPGSGTGTFAPPTVPNGTGVTAYGMTISGLSSTPETVDISDFVVIGGPGPAFFGSSGTTPNNRFDFELQTLSEDYVNSTTAYFTGTGILTDTQDAYSPTAAEFLLSFSGVNNYSFTLQAVPEPATLGLVTVGLLGTLAFRRRKN